MENISEIDKLMVDLLGDHITYEPFGVTERGMQIVEEICDFAEETDIFKNEKRRGEETFKEGTAQDVYEYMLRKILNAPNHLFRRYSVILIMPFLKRKLKKEETPDETSDKAADMRENV